MPDYFLAESIDFLDSCNCANIVARDPARGDGSKSQVSHK